MENSNEKSLYYATHAAYAKGSVQDCAKLTLPETIKWATDKVHPLLLSVLLPYINDDEKFTIGVGENTEGLFLSVYDNREDEVMRMTAHLTRVGKTCGWLGDRRSGPSGLWLLGGESFESPPFASPMTRRSPFHDMRNVLKAVQVFGGDQDLDVLHRGTFVEHRLGRASRVSEHYTFGDVIWTLTYRPARVCDPNMDNLVLRIEDQCSSLGDSIVVRTTNEQDTYETAYFFPVTGDYGRDGEAVEEDAVIVIDTCGYVLPPGVVLQSQSPYYQQLMEKFAGDDNWIRCVVEYLLSSDESLGVSHIPSKQDDPYETFIAIPLMVGLPSVKAYRLRIRR